MVCYVLLVPENSLVKKMIKIKADNELLDLIGAVIRLNGIIKTSFSSVNSSFGIAPVEAMVLTTVAESADQFAEQFTVSQIGRIIGHRRQAVQRAATALEKNGLIKFIDNPNHKRAPLLVPTKKGLNLFEKINSRVTGISEDILLHLGKKNCQRIADGLKTLTDDYEQVIQDIQLNK